MDLKYNGNMMIFDDIAEKEMMMYRAVIDMVYEDYDINSIKVSDITGRAGIGKGTAYEYFSSKEEIIVKALLYDTYMQLKRIENILQEKKPFKAKFLCLLDYLEENLLHTKGVSSLMKIFSGTYEMKDDFRHEVSKIQAKTACPIYFIENMIDSFMNQGIEENIFGEKDIIICRSVFATQVTGYMYCIMNQYYDGKFPRGKAREFAYDGIVKLLNP